MADGITNITIELISRIAAKRGPTSSEAYNDLQNETIATFTGFATQWNSELVPLLGGLPNGTNDLDPWTKGLDGTGIYADMTATSNAVNLTYWNSVRGRPNSIREQFDNVYAEFITLSDQLQADIIAAIAANGGLTPTGVVPGSYTNTNLTVNQYGLITAATNGNASGVTGGNGITVTGTSVAVNLAYVFGWTGAQTWSNTATFNDGVIVGAGMVVQTPQLTTPPATATVSSTTTVNWAASAIQTVALGQNTTIAFTGAVSGQTLMLEINSSGSYTVAWPTMFWPGGTVPTMTSGGIDIYTIIYSGSTYYASALQAFAT